MCTGLASAAKPVVGGAGRESFREWLSRRRWQLRVLHGACSAAPRVMIGAALQSCDDTTTDRLKMASVGRKSSRDLAPADTSAARRDVAADTAALLRKPVNTLAIVPKSHKITSLGRKSYNVLLHEAQEQGLENDVFRMPLERIVRSVGFDSNDQELIKKHLRAMVSTTVEWQSPTTGEGLSWNISGLLAHAKLSKVRGQVWVEWSYAINLKQELLEPTVFARLSLQIISTLRSHAGIALYEICSRYKSIGRTSRQAWQWWRPVLSGRPESEQTARLEYRIFKRDTLKPAIAEVCALTDIEIELVEHRQGRFIGELQFLIRPNGARSTPPQRPAAAVAVDAEAPLVHRARELGIDPEQIGALVCAHGPIAVDGAIETATRRAASSYPEPLRDAYRYVKAVLTDKQVNAPAVPAEAHVVASAADASQIERRRLDARQAEESIRYQRERIVEDIARLSPEAQARLVESLLTDMESRQVHPSIRKRLRASGWQHPLVMPEMVRYYVQAVDGPGWEQPALDQPPDATQSIEREAGTK